VGGGDKIIKDFYDKKTTKIWLVAVETLLVVSALYIGIFGRLYQKGKDAENRDALNRRVDDVATHGDSSISKAKHDIIDSSGVNFRQLQDTIKILRKENQAQKQVIAMDRKPSITIQPDANGSNPRLDKINDDSIKCLILFQNCGSASAYSFHSRTIFLRCDKHENPDTILRFTIADMNSIANLLPLCLEGGFQLTRKIKFQPKENTILIAAITYCYEDSLGRKYGPITNMFEWLRKVSKKMCLT